MADSLVELARHPTIKALDPNFAALEDMFAAGCVPEADRKAEQHARMESLSAGTLHLAAS